VCRRYRSINLREVTKLGTAVGGRFLDGTRFTYEGGKFDRCSPCSATSAKGEMRERSLGVKIPPTNLKPNFETQALDLREPAGGHSRRRTRTTTCGNVECLTRPISVGAAPSPRTVPPDSTTGSRDGVGGSGRAEDNPETSCCESTPWCGRVTWKTVCRTNLSLALAARREAPWSPHLPPLPRSGD
jgi:hypothetical protein